MSYAWKEKCGVAGVFGHPKASKIIELMLRALQHRGTESAGAASSDGETIRVQKEMGLVAKLFTPETHKQLKGFMSIGHTRYSTAGGSTIANAQPLIGKNEHGQIAVAHNGNVINAKEVQKSDLHGALFQTDSDTEVILHLIARSSKPNIVEAVQEALLKLDGAFSLVLMTADTIIAVRDPQGFRPLVMGKLCKDGYSATLFASETCALDLVGASYEGNVLPGEMVIVNEQGITRHIYRQAPLAQCVFEHVYFSDPESLDNGRSEYNFRKMCGNLLAAEHPVNAAIVIPVPNSGVPAAVGYSQRSGISLEMALIRKDHIGRTFIQPTQEIRDLAVRLKLRPVRDVVEGQSVVLVDDSIVRGTTSRQIVEMVRDAGAKEVHLRIACPPTVSPCFYGVDTPDKSQLIAATKSINEICEYVTADSLGYLSLASLQKVVSGKPNDYCYACYSGVYPASLIQVTQ